LGFTAFLAFLPWCGKKWELIADMQSTKNYQTIEEPHETDVQRNWLLSDISGKSI